MKQKNTRLTEGRANVFLFSGWHVDMWGQQYLLNLAIDEVTYLW